MRTVQWKVALMMLFHVHPLYKWTCVCLQLCLHCVQSLQHDPSTAWQARANSSVSVLSAPFSVLQFPSNSVSTLSVRYKLSRVGFVLMGPLLVLAVSFHGWVQLQRSCVSDPCNTLLLRGRSASTGPLSEYGVGAALLLASQQRQ
jgi:hypothetical protein